MSKPKKHKAYPMRVCHNPKCQNLFLPHRVDQLHCDRVCADRCRPCHEMYEKDYQVRLKARKRKTQQGLKGAVAIVDALGKSRGLQIRMPMVFERGEPGTGTLGRPPKKYDPWAEILEEQTSNY